MTETPTDTDARPFTSRLRQRLESITPLALAMLGFVEFLGDAFTRLD